MLDVSTISPRSVYSPLMCHRTVYARVLFGNDALSIWSFSVQVTPNASLPPNYDDTLLTKNYSAYNAG